MVLESLWRLTFSPALKRGDSFSLIASYADAPVGLPPHARGGCHNPNYWAYAQILAPDVHRADAIPMETEPTGRTRIHATMRLAPMSAARTLLRGVGFVLERHAHPQSLGLVGNHPADVARDHLVDVLVGGWTVVHPLPQIPHIAHDHRLHPARVEGGDQGGRLLVQDVANLVIQLPKLLPLAPLELAPVSGTLLQASLRCSQCRLDLVLILAFGPQSASVDDRGVLAVVDHGEMGLAQIDPSRFVPRRFGNRSRFVVDTPQFIRRTRPSQFDQHWSPPGPRHDQRLVSSSIGADQLLIPHPNRR